MEGYLQQIVQCALSKVFIDKLSYVEDICFSADVSIGVDRTEIFKFCVTDRIQKDNAAHYQEQFAQLTGSRPTLQPQYDRQDVGVQWEVGEGGITLDAASQTDTLSDWNGGSSGGMESDHVNDGRSNQEEGKETADSVEKSNKQNEKVMVDVEVQTDEMKKGESKRKPRKPGTQQRKSKRISEVNDIPMDIKLEDVEEENKDPKPFSDTGSDVEELTYVPALPPPDPTPSKPENEQVTCPLCPAQFKSQQGAENHLRVKHDIGNVYVCSVCQEVCPSNNALSQHYIDVHGSVMEDLEAQKPKRKKRGRKPSLKSTKSTGSKRKKNVNRTVRKGKKNLSVVISTTGLKTSVETKGIQKCPECPKEYSSKRALSRHMKTVHEAKRYQCDICGKIFTSKETLYHHRRGIHSDNKPYQCEECGASFNFNHSLRLHRLKHSGVRPHECKECHKTYLTANHLKMHMQGVHKEKKSHSCHICGKAFSYTTSLKVHIMTHGDVRPYKCNVCSQGFVNSHSLKYHKEAKHSSNTWFDCDVCGKKYKTEFLMKTHRRRHTPDGQRYMCDICGRQFMYKSTLEIHTAVHSDEKSFQCTQCGKSFKTYATLYSHQYVHKADSPFKCPECGKAFKTKERCKAHQRRHSGLKPFECELCGRCFPDKGGLSKHTKTVHCDVKKFVCGVCGKACSRGDNLRVHMKIHSKNTDGTVNATVQRKPKGQPSSAATSQDLATVAKGVFSGGREIPNITPQSTTLAGDSSLTNISSPNASPPPSMAPLPRAYQDRLDPPPFIPNADSLTIPSALNLHANPLVTCQDSEVNQVQCHTAPITMHPGNNPSNPMIPSSLPQMTSVSPYVQYQMWHYLQNPHVSGQQSNDGGNPYY